ncbi:unnamed protein product [Amoebophrya sp. A120]|nr:unnamed protein product [Amoebophrya sp. A120]|eukprot:GSA120T00023823001.1
MVIFFFGRHSSEYFQLRRIFICYPESKSIQPVPEVISSCFSLKCGISIPAKANRSNRRNFFPVAFRWTVVVLRFHLSEQNLNRSNRNFYLWRRSVVLPVGVVYCKS